MLFDITNHIWLIGFSNHRLGCCFGTIGSWRYFHGTSAAMLVVHTANTEVLQEARNDIIFVKHRTDCCLELWVVFDDFLHKWNADQRLPKGDADDLLFEDICVDLAPPPNVSSNTASQHPSKREPYERCTFLKNGRVCTCASINVHI